MKTQIPIPRLEPSRLQPKRFQPSSWSSFHPSILVMLSSWLGMALVFYATRYGPGVGGDATIYLTTGRNLLAGLGPGWVDADGSFRVLPYFPPFYPLVLSLVGLIFRGDFVTGARFLNVVLFGASTWGAGMLFSRWTGRPWLAGLLTLTLAASPVLLGVTVWAMSEPLFILLGFAGLGLLLLYFDNGRRAYLWGSAVLVGLSCVARYIGVAFVATAFLALLLSVWRNANRPSSPPPPDRKSTR